MTSPPEIRTHLRRYGLAVVVLIALFSLPLYHLARFSMGSELYSHILLMPCISLYLVWDRRQSLPEIGPPDFRLALPLAAAGLIGLTAYASMAGTWAAIAPENGLALMMTVFLAFFVALNAGFLGRPLIRALAFPLGLLVFMVPFPVALLSTIESGLQYGSACAARLLFGAAGTTVFYHDLTFQLPGITLEVAPECSGIRSTLALLITSLLVGHFFLHSRWNRSILALVVIPLGLARNGLRIFTIGELCVRIGPHMINSYIHRKGGPVFFAAALIPFFLLLGYFVKRERRAAAKIPKP